MINVKIVDSIPVFPLHSFGVRVGIVEDGEAPVTCDSRHSSCCSFLGVIPFQQSDKLFRNNCFT